MSMATEVEEFIVQEIALGRGIDTVAHDQDLLADEVIDSLGIVEVISFLEGKYGVKVDDDDLAPENFQLGRQHRRLRREEAELARRCRCDSSMSRPRRVPTTRRSSIATSGSPSASWSSGSSGSRTGSPARHRARRLGRPGSARRPLVRHLLSRDHRARRDRGPGQPGLQAGRARVLLPQRRRRRGDQRRAQRRRLRAHRRRLRPPGRGDRQRCRPWQSRRHSTACSRRERPSAFPRAPPRRSSSTSSPPARPAGRSWCRAPTASARRGGLYKSLGTHPRGRIFSAIPLFHTYGMGACLFGAAVSGATIVILEDPHPFLLKRHRALELIEARARRPSSPASPSTSA